MPKKKEDEVTATLMHDGKTAPFPSKEAEDLMVTMIRKLIPGGVLTAFDLHGISQELRRLVILNAHRIPSFRQIADKLGAIETLIVEGVGKADDKLQEKLPLDPPETVDKELRGES